MIGYWRVGRRVPVHLYRDNEPAGTCLSEEQAAEIAGMSAALAEVETWCARVIAAGLQPEARAAGAVRAAIRTGMDRAR